MLEPYLRHDGTTTAERGLSHVAPEELEAHVTALDREGFQVHFHAIGDRAVREALDALEAARVANGANDLRHHIAHLQVVHPDDVPEVEPFLPHERLNLETCLEAFTLGSAFVNHLDDVTGSIAPGKLADLTVLDRNPFGEGKAAIGEARVILTLVDGRQVYAD